MEIKREIVNALQLFMLLCLLFWSFTWNTPRNFDFSQSRHTNLLKFHRNPNSIYAGNVKELPLTPNKHTIILESFKYGAKKTPKISTADNSILPSFNEWKEVQLHKQGKSTTPENNIPGQKRATRRKLNYSSSKCGAKILASNPEAKYSMAILNEKVDEYMLNPCRAKSWFVIELCDTVEATQVELANYELYSSSPKLFSVFGSEIFPTKVWHSLGVFEAKDQRTMQTFELHNHNLAKFIKIIISSHHGKEHYCPLSVVRILGVSMVHDFEEIEISGEITQDLGSPLNNATSKEAVMNNATYVKSSMPVKSGKQEDMNNLKNASSLSTTGHGLYPLLLKYCLPFGLKKAQNSCLNKPLCRFLRKIMKLPRKICKNPFANFSSINPSKQYLFNTSSNIQKAFLNHTGKSETSNYLPNQTNSDTKLESEIRKNLVTKSIDERNTETKNTFDECPCDNIPSKAQKLTNTIISDQDLLEYEDIVDSAGLIQKESVLVRLTSRIKNSELNLDLINKYLQRLSQSYRQQMEEMQTMFNETVSAISLASEKAVVMDNQQQEELTLLGRKLQALSHNIALLTSGYEDTYKRVVELHAFFLILELIIISTIFTIFLHALQQKRDLVQKISSHISREKDFKVIIRNGYGPRRWK